MVGNLMSLKYKQLHDIVYCISPAVYIQRCRNIDNGGGGGGGADIHIFVFTDCKLKQSISKEINWAEHEYMNICPPPPNYRYSGASVYIHLW